MQPIQSVLKGDSDIFITRIGSVGDSLEYSTYLGGNSSDKATRIDVDLEGNAFVTGSTNSHDFPQVHAIQGFAGLADVFILKLKSNGQALLFSTFLGGRDGDGGYGIATDEQNSIYVTGVAGIDFPTVNALQPDWNEGYGCHNPNCPDSFISKFSLTGSTTGIDVYVDLPPTSSGQPGGVASIPIEVGNLGESLTTGVTLTATLEDGLSYFGDTSGITATVAGNQINWQFPELVFLETRQFNLLVNVPADAELGALYTITFTANPVETDDLPENNTALIEVMAARWLFLPVIRR
jgi:hypothetical protein